MLSNMRTTSLLAGFSLVLGAFGLRVRQEEGANPATNETASVAPKHYIVEFQPDVDTAAAAKQVADNNGGKVLKVFQSDVFRGCAIEAQEDNADTLQALEAVSQAWPARKLFLGPIEPTALMAGDAVLENYTVHHLTGVDKLHEAGIRGKGAKVAVIDTGINYDHPALGGGLGDGFKVSGGYDFVGNGVWPTPGEVKAPDEDPNDQQGHGTHVAGIVAGRSDAMTGVAPEAELRAYKVFGSIDGTDEETIIEAMLQAYEDGVDIITISIGGLDGWSDGPWALVASRMVELGVLITISAGNDGNVGAFAGNGGSSGANVLAVASLEPDVITVPGFMLSFSQENGSSKDSWTPYHSIIEWYPTEVEGWPIVPLSLEPLENEACEELPEDTPDFTGKVVLVRRGGCTFQDKQYYLSMFNAYYIIFYSNDQPFVAPSTLTPFASLAMVMAETGKAIIDAVAAGGNVTANFNYPSDRNRIAVKTFDLPGVASTFTSVGPTNDLFIKSDIAAPGGRILSTYLGDGFAEMSGTSMSCPYIAGVAALYVGKYGGRATQGPSWAKTLAMKIIASGDALPWDDGLLSGTTYDFFAPVPQVGTGRVNASKILAYETELSLSKFALNDTTHFSRYHKVDITNKGSRPVTYKFSQQAFGGMNTMNTDPAAWATPRIAWAEELMVNPVKLVPSISFPGGSFTVQPGQTKTAQFNFKAPEGAVAKNLPVYSGKVIISGSNGDELSVPYLGLAADLKRDNELMYQDPIGLPIFTSGRFDLPIGDKASFTFNLSREEQDYPRAHARLQYATRELRWDIFEAGWQERQWKYPPVVGQDGYLGAATSWSRASSGWAFNPEVDDADSLIATPLRNVPRSVTGRRGVDLWWLGRFANGTQIIPGDYRMRFAVLKPFGNPKAADNWDVVETPLITVV
ncbi:serine endopeptidase [Paramyrothecium foliicola]|nr:serine endopeptidase [Paramyrothecium foliicola]